MPVDASVVAVAPELALNHLTRRIRQVGVGVAQGRVVAAVGDEGDDDAEERANEDILPVVPVVHRPRDGDEDGAEHGRTRKPCTRLVAAGREEVELAGEIKGEDRQAGKRERACGGSG